jgi:hypothetical protein
MCRVTKTQKFFSGFTSMASGHQANNVTGFDGERLNEKGSGNYLGVYGGSPEKRQQKKTLNNLSVFLP